MQIFGISLDFILFGLTLLGIASFHKYTLPIAFAGLFAILAYKLGISGFSTGPGLPGLATHLAHEWVLLADLLGLLTGFAILAEHFEKSHVPEKLPAHLPAGWKGGFALLVMVFIMSGFLDNIAGALIGGTMAYKLFHGKVHLGYLAAIVAASNAGGAGSVIGDTTTTMMWASGISPLLVIDAYIAATVALLVVGIVGAKQQHAYFPLPQYVPQDIVVDKARLMIVGLMLTFTVTTNIVVNLNFPHLSDQIPFLGLALWSAILITSRVRRHSWEILPGTLKNTAFLLSLVLAASMMPVDQLPSPTWQTALGMGFVSAVFDNIPLTALALKQGGYDWGILAYAVGFGGSMVWFGSSAGIALSGKFQEIKSVYRWVTQGWHVVLAYPAGFFVMLAILGWNA
jgi:Na+/H+ antiporter NhaD/arsenite permease-like protein